MKAGISFAAALFLYYHTAVFLHGQEKIEKQTSLVCVCALKNCACNTKKLSNR